MPGDQAADGSIAGSRRLRSRWLTLAIGFGLQGLGLLVDGLYHAAHPHEATSPLWVHLPADVGIVVVLAGLVTGTVSGFGVLDRIGVAATGLQAAAVSWSVVVEAEKHDFYLPVTVAAIGGVAAFATLVVVPVVRLWRVHRV